jgi:hypothetical protein
MSVQEKRQGEGWDQYHNRCTLERWKKELAENPGKPVKAKIAKVFQKKGAHPSDSLDVWPRVVKADKKRIMKKHENISDSSAIWERGVKIGAPSVKKTDEVWKNFKGRNG